MAYRSEPKKEGEKERENGNSREIDRELTWFSGLPDMKDPIRVNMAHRNTPKAMMFRREYRSPKM